MCEPTLIALGSLAVTAAGSYMQYEGQQAALDAQRSASERAAANTRMELQRQEEIRQRSAVVADETAQAGAREAVDQGIQQNTDRRNADYAEAAAANGQNRDIAGTAMASNLVQNSIADRTAEARARLASEALARAKMGAWGDTFLHLGEGNQRRRDQIDAFGSFSRGSAGASSVEQAAAQKDYQLGAFEGAGDRALGGAISALGNAGLANAKQINGWFSNPQPSGGAMAAYPP